MKKNQQKPYNELQSPTVRVTAFSRRPDFLTAFAVSRPLSAREPSNDTNAA